MSKSSGKPKKPKQPNKSIEGQAPSSDVRVIATMLKGLPAFQSILTQYPDGKDRVLEIVVVEQQHGHQMECEESARLTRAANINGGLAIARVIIAACYLIACFALATYLFIDKQLWAGMAALAGGYAPVLPRFLQRFGKATGESPIERGPKD
jgi:hypothetical protein